MKIGIPVAKSKTQIFLNQAYVDYVAGAGFDPILINGQNNIIQAAQYCDGLLLPGGVDLEPTYYGDDNNASIGCDPERDDFERQVYYSFIMEKKKIFGICRGFQLIVKEFLTTHRIKNSNFYQHINNHSLANTREAKRSTPTHSVFANMALLYGREDSSIIFVNSMHHQALLSKTPINEMYANGDSIKETAITRFSLKDKDKDHIVEAVDVLIDGCEVRGVQWHPEELMDIALLQTFFSKNAKGLKHGGQEKQKA